MQVMISTTAALADVSFGQSQLLSYTISSVANVPRCLQLIIDKVKCVRRIHGVTRAPHQSAFRLGADNAQQMPEPSLDAKDRCGS